MADKSLIMRSFNSHFVDFINDVLIVIPDNKDIVNGLNSFEIIKRVNPSLMTKVWYSNIYLPYKSNIDDGDFSFFIDKNYSIDLKKVSNAKDVMNIIEQIREPIKTMDDISKQHTMEYVKNLSELSRIYNSMK